MLENKDLEEMRQGQGGGGGSGGGGGRLADKCMLYNKNLK
jgi:hypothetical protein